MRNSMVEGSVSCLKAGIPKTQSVDCIFHCSADCFNVVQTSVLVKPKQQALKDTVNNFLFVQCCAVSLDRLVFCVLFWQPSTLRAQRSHLICSTDRKCQATSQVFIMTAYRESQSQILLTHCSYPKLKRKIQFMNICRWKISQNRDLHCSPSFIPVYVVWERILF